MKLKLLGVLAIVCATQTLLPAQATSNEVVMLNNDGVMAIKSNNYQLAISKFEEALSKDPSYSLARENLAIAYNNYGISLQNNPQAALEKFHKALYYGPDNATAVQNLEMTMQNLGLDPRSSKDHFDLGRSAQKSGDLEGAIVEYTAALKIKEDPTLRVRLGDVLRVKENPDQAIANYQIVTRATNIDPDIAVKAFTGMGLCYQAKEDFANAASAYNEAIKINKSDREALEANRALWAKAVDQAPLDANNHIGLGQSYAYLGDFGLAKAEYQQSLVFKPGNHIALKLLSGLAQASKEFDRDNHINQGVDLQSRKLYDPAIQEYNFALSLDSNNPDILANLGSAYQAKEDYKTAIDFYNRALAIVPNHPQATLGLKNSLEEYKQQRLDQAASSASDAFKTGNFAVALSNYQELLRTKPKDAGIHFNIALTLQQMKRLDEAIVEYQTAVGLDSSNTQYAAALQKALQAKADPIIDLAVSKHGQKDYTGAIDLYQQALALVPDNLKVMFNLAGAYYSRQQYDEAYRLYQTLVQKDPKGQVDDLWLIGTIQENASKGYDAAATYTRYLSLAPAGQYAGAARARLEILRKNPNDTTKIKSDAELAQEQAADDAYKAAVKLQQDKHFDEAQEQYQKAMSIKPKEYAYPFGLGTLFQQKGDIDQAITWYQSALNLAQADPKIDSKTLNEFKEAITVAYEIKAKPVIDQAIEKQKAGDYISAISLYKQALELMPNTARLWTNLAQAYQMTDDFASARTAYQKAIDINQKDEAANWYVLGALDENFNQGNLAVEHYRKYLLAMPQGQFANLANQRLAVLIKNPAATQKLPTQNELKQLTTARQFYEDGVKLQQSGDAAGALEKYKQASLLMVNEPAYVQAMATAYEALKDYDSALQCYDKAIQMNPKNQDWPKQREACAELKVAPVVDDALKAFQAQDYTNAAKLYQQVLQAIPNSAEMHSNLAATLQAADDFAGARAEYQKAYDLDPKGQKENLYLVAVLTEHVGQGQQALNLYRKYISESPYGKYIQTAKQRAVALSKNITATVKLPTSNEIKQSQAIQDLINKGNKAYEAKNYAEAVSAFQEASNISGDPSCYYALSLALQGAGHIDEASDACKTACTKDPSNKTYAALRDNLSGNKAQPFLDDAVKKQTAGNYAGAIDAYHKALEIMPNNARLHTNLATALQASDNFAGAQEEFQKALNMDHKQEVENLYFLAVLDENYGHGIQALQKYRTYLAEAPHGTYTQLANQRAKDLQLNPNKTQHLTTQAEQQAVSQTNEAYTQGVQLQQAGKLDEALAKYNEALKLNPNEPSIWFALATVQQAKQNLDDSISAYRKAISLNPQEQSWKQDLKQVQQAKAAPLLQSAFQKQTTKDAKGNFDLAGAILDYEKSLQIDDDATTHLNLGTAYQQLNNLPKALENYKKAILLDPNQYDAYYYMGTVYEGIKQPYLAKQEYKQYLLKQPSGPNATACRDRLKILAAK